MARTRAQDSDGDDSGGPGPAVAKQARTGGKQPQSKCGRLRWTSEEVEQLKRGYQKYGEGRWADILREFKFHKHRTNARRPVPPSPPPAHPPAPRPPPSRLPRRAAWESLTRARRRHAARSTSRTSGGT